MSAAPSTSWAFELRHSVLGYRAPVLTGIDLRAAHGELVGILGRSGAGKSTLLAALSGADVQLGGTVTVNGADPRRSTHPVGLVPQLSDETVTRLNIAEIVALGAPRTGLFTSRSERAAANAALERLGLHGHSTRRLDELSGGQRQRVAIARALTGSTNLLLCDEPTSGADPVLAEEIVTVLAEVASAGTTVLIATHDLAVVAPQLHRLVGIGAGSIRYDGVPADFDDTARTAVYGAELTLSARR
jgi:ABC-type Mn2+/Zn2+ transport system ATPase subunit